MAAFITRAVFGEQVAGQLKDGDLAELVSQHYAAFFWGLQGRDLLFYSRKLSRDFTSEKRALFYGTPEGRLVKLMCNYIIHLEGCTEYDPMRAYLAGYVYSLRLDAITAPYIQRLTMRTEKRNTNHAFQGWDVIIQSNLDSELYHYVHNAPVSSFVFEEKYIAGPVVENAIARMYAYILYKMYGIDTEYARVGTCFGAAVKRISGYLRYFKGTYYGIRLWELLTGQRYRYSAHYRREKVGGDILNLNRRPWPTPPAGDGDRDPEECTESFPDLLEQAVSYGTRAGEKVLDTLKDRTHTSMSQIKPPVAADRRDS